MSEEAIALLSEATAPPMKTITAAGHKLGGETPSLFRHEKTLVNRNVYAVQVGDCLDDAAADAALAQLKKVDYERIGEREYVEFVFVHDAGRDTETLVRFAQKAAATGRGVIVETTDRTPRRLSSQRAPRPSLTASTRRTGRPCRLRLAARPSWPSAARACRRFTTRWKSWRRRATRICSSMSPVGRSRKRLPTPSKPARGAILDGVRTLGYPSIVNIARLAWGDAHLQTALASLFTVKYGSILVMEHMSYAQALPLFGLRQNIYTDPQKPMKVAPGIYPMNGATADSPCLLTVDFALTYFLVSGELERSKVPVNLLITDAPACPS